MKPSFIHSTDIFNIISRHRGSENAIGAHDIAHELNFEIDERTVRRVIAAERDQWPAVVCAKAGKGEDAGYFVAQTFEEIQAYWAWLDDLRAKAEAKVERFEALCRKQGIKLHHEKAAA